VSQTFYSHRFDNGVTLIAEQMEWLESVAISLAAPGGYTRDPLDLPGLSNFTCEMTLRGCGPRDSRQFMQDLANLGVKHSSGVGAESVGHRAAMESGTLRTALPIFTDLLMRPHLPEDQLEDGRRVCEQEILAVGDDLSQQMFNELRRRTYPFPYGRHAHGEMEAIQQITIDDIRNHYAATHRPDETLVSVAGKFEWESLRNQTGNLTAAWESQPRPKVEEAPPEHGHHHIQFDSNQTQIGISFAAPAYRDENYFLNRAAIGVLSDGMSSRLFTEVREKRGLVYGVGATCDSLRETGAVYCYASSSTANAQETLEVIVAEVNKLTAGIEEEELARIKVQMKTGLVMEQESSRSRVAALASDWRLLGRVRTREELNQMIEDLTCEKVNAYLAEHPPGGFTVVTLGEKPLEVSRAIS